MGAKSIFSVLAEFYTFICMRLKAVEKHPDYLAIVKRQNRQWNVNSIKQNCELSGEKTEPYCHILFASFI